MFTAEAFVSPKSFAVFMDGPACGKVRQVPGRPSTIRYEYGAGSTVYVLSAGYNEHGLAALFYREVKR